MSTPPIDFVTARTAAMRQRPSKRSKAVEDCAFWRCYAAEYDARAEAAGTSSRCLTLVVGLLALHESGYCYSCQQAVGAVIWRAGVVR